MPTSSPADFVVHYRKSLTKYQAANNGKAVWETVATLLLFVGLWSTMAWLSQINLWLPPLLMCPAALFLVRLFMIQHDCGHGAMFSSRWANDWTGRALGALTLTPYDYWRRAHGIHHASSGHLGKRGIGDITTLTVSEYRALPPLRQLTYKIYRHPLVLFVIGPAWLFLFQHRLPVGAMRDGLLPWASTMLTNIAIAGVLLLLISILGVTAVLVVHLPVVLFAASVGVWLFYVQHQFENTSWENDDNWSHSAAALHGSSYYDLPPPLMWLTGYIGIHHVHHVNSRIPFYRLQSALDAHPELKVVSRLTFMQSIRCIRLSLWDEDEKRLIPFSHHSATAL